MPKDPTKNVDRYKIRGGALNEFEFNQNQADFAEAENTPTNLIPGTPPEAKAQLRAKKAQQRSTRKPTKDANAKSAGTKKSSKHRGSKKSAKGATAKKSAGKKSSAKRATAKKSAAKKSAGKKSAAKKSSAKKSAAKKAAKSRRGSKK
jgi:hypothetical protein